MAGVGSQWIAELDRISNALREELATMGIAIGRPHPLVLSLSRAEASVLVIHSVLWASERGLLKPFQARIAQGNALVVLAGTPEEAPAKSLSEGVTAVLDIPLRREALFVASLRAIELIEARARALAHERSATRSDYELDELLGISQAMTTERDVDKLLALILEKSRAITAADAGSIFVAEAGANLGDGSEPVPLLRFKLSQNDSVSFDSREFTIPISSKSIAGAAAENKRLIAIDDVYQMPPGSPFRFDKSFDEKVGYRTKSVIAMPLVSQRGEAIGVIQLINKKRDKTLSLANTSEVDARVVPFDERSQELIALLATQAAAALEAALLYDEIRKLFEGFVTASVEAIEARDPTTSGHSRRVADFTVGLAKVVDQESSGAYREAQFSQEDLREIEYASLLHDFGKIGVKERVLVKAKKLDAEHLTLIESRFDFVARTIEVEALRKRMAAIESGASVSSLRNLDLEFEARIASLEESYRLVLSANEPTVLQEGDFARIAQIAQDTFTDRRGIAQSLLTPHEVTALSIRRGTLTSEEYDEIRGHVSHTFRFLSRIPWGKALRRVPAIAGAHHERLNGTGYPNKWRAEAIPLQAKMMSIADIFDALTASDRPYKKAMPAERALDILGYEVKDGHVDGELVRLFREARVWERGT